MLWTFAKRWKHKKNNQGLGSTVPPDSEPALRGDSPGPLHFQDWIESVPERSRRIEFARFPHSGKIRCSIIDSAPDNGPTISAFDEADNADLAFHKVLNKITPPSAALPPTSDLAEQHDPNKKENL